jgi:CTP synthase
VPLTEDVRRKLSLFCNVAYDAVIEEQDVQHTIYEVPLVLAEQGLDELVMVHFRLVKPPSKMNGWRRMVEIIKNPRANIRIGVVGKYSELQDAYKSLYEAISHGGIAHQVSVEIVKISAEEIEAGRAQQQLKEVAGILVPGGFGSRGVEGKIMAIKYARENGVPFLGICYGLQCAVIEFARNVCGLAGAHTTEINKDAPHPVVCLMEEQAKVVDLGATMRLGAWPCRLAKDSKAQAAYGEDAISERHRHRYEVNNAYREELEKKGLVLSGLSPDGHLVEIIELADHPWFVATQFHPELKSQPMMPHPLFRDFIGAAVEFENI